MKCLVTGASGFLGRQVADRLRRDYEVIGQSFSHAGENLIQADLSKKEAIHEVVDKVEPDLVVHCAAYRDPDFCETRPDETRILNTQSVETFIACLPGSARFVFISSDYVFDGRNPPYREDSSRNAVNIYGRSKLEAEDVLISHDNALILRIPFLVGTGPDGKADGLIALSMKLIQQKEPEKLDNGAIRFPTWTNDVAAALAYLVDQDTTGIVHYSALRGGTKYQWMREVADILGESADHIQPIDHQAAVATRPHDAQLATDKIRGMGYDRFTDFSDVVKSVLS